MSCSKAWNRGLTAKTNETLRLMGRKVSEATKGMRRSPKTEFKSVPIGHKWIRDDKWGKRIIVKIGPRKYRAEHVLVAEAVYGKLRPGQIVHHIDCDPYNNAPDNLYVTDHRTHASLHKFEPMIKELLRRGILKFNRQEGKYELQQIS